MIPYWETLVALPAVGAGITVSTTPTQVLASTKMAGSSLGRPSKKAQVRAYNDDAANTVTLTVTQTDDVTRPNYTPQTATMGPQTMAVVEIADVADQFISASAVSSAGTAAVRVAVLAKDTA